MHIREYFHRIQTTLHRASHIGSQHITFDERSESIGYLTGQILFVDGSRLYLSQYVDVEHGIEVIKYSYHLMRENQVLFRYDNASDPHAKHLSTYPHHKHVDGQLVESEPPTLEVVLEEAVNLLEIG